MLWVLTADTNDDPVVDDGGSLIGLIKSDLHLVFAYHRLYFEILPVSLKI